MAAELIELSNTLAETTEQVAKSAVAVHTEARGSSSGVVWQSGLIVTAEHALRRDEEIQVTLADGRVVPALLAGRDPRTDLALLKCAEAGTPLGEVDKEQTVKPGSLALVVGRTRASGPVAGLGVVSLVAPERRTWTGGSLSPYIRLDLALEPTAVGGVAVAADGNPIGLASPRFARFGATAVPAATVSAVLATLLAKGRVPVGYLGVGLQPVRLPEALRQALERTERNATIVLDVEPNGPAHNAGILIGDILVSLAGRAVTRLEDIQAQLQGQTIGKSVPAKLVRGGALQETTIVVGERPHGGD